jgi:hypothetical protein
MNLPSNIAILKKLNPFKPSGTLSTKQLVKKAQKAEKLLNLIESHSFFDRFKHVDFTANTKGIYISIQVDSKNWVDDEFKTNETISLDIKYNSLTQEQSQNLRSIISEITDVNANQIKNPRMLGLVLVSTKAYLDEQIEANLAFDNMA